MGSVRHSRASFFFLENVFLLYWTHTEPRNYKTTLQCSILIRIRDVQGTTGPNVNRNLLS